MLQRLPFLLALFVIVWIPAHAQQMDVDNSCTGSTPVAATFSFLIPAPIGGISSECFSTTTIAFQTLDFLFEAPPGPPLLTCASTFFGVCSINETAGMTDVHYEKGSDSGIPISTDFNVKLQGFTTGEQINAVANTPEPEMTLPIGFLLLSAAAISVWRRVRQQSMRDRIESSSAC
jgi:hypothetical protein